MAAARARLIDSLAERIGTPPLTPAEIESVLAAPSAAAPPRPRRRSDGEAVAPRERDQARPVDRHVGAPPVGVRPAAPGAVALVVERAREALGVADHLRERDPVAPHQPERERERGAHLRRVA